MLQEKAKAFALKTHGDQTDKAGAPYSDHLLFVADKVTGDKEKCVAYLHDTLEDTDTKESDLRSLFGDEITDAVVAMTHKDDEPYFDYILRLKKNRISATVKAADLTHNMMLERISNPTEDDRSRVAKYQKAYELLKHRGVN